MAITFIVLILLNALLCFASAAAIHSLIQRLRLNFGAARYSWLILGSMATGCAVWTCQFIGLLVTDGLPAGELPANGVFLSVAVSIMATAGYSFLRLRFQYKKPERWLIASSSALLITGLLLGFAGFASGWLSLLFYGIANAQSWGDGRGALLASVLMAGMCTVGALQHRRRYKSATALFGGLLFIAPLLAMPDISKLPTVVPDRQLAITAVVLGLFAMSFLAVLILTVGLDSQLKHKASMLNKQWELAVSDLAAESEQRTARLAAKKERAETLLQSIADAVITTNREGRVETMNPAAAKLLQLNIKQVKGLPLSAVYCIVESQVPVSELAAKRRHQVTRKLQLQDGSELAVSESRSEIHDSEGVLEGEILVFGDVSQSLERAEELARQARTDSLTGLSNRTEFERQLKKALQRSGRGEARLAPVLLYLDLDQFKPVNDSAGHAAGDELLRQLAEAMRSKVEQAGVGGSVARLGGDEFGILLEGSRLPQAVALAEALCDEICEFCFGWRQQTFRVGASIGLVELNAAIRDPEVAIKQADQACYIAKRGGRGCVEVFTASDDELQELKQEGQWQQRLRRALDDDRFELYYEDIAPLYGLADGSQFEVLLRMRDEHDKLVPATAFLPAAQRFGMAAEIDRWVFVHALEFLARTSIEQARLCTINISAATLTDSKFAKWLERKLVSLNVDGSRVCIDIPESMAISQLSDALAFMRSLKALGCRFALDGFGSGMATFGYLKKLPLNFIKIDSAFVRDIGSDRLDRAIVAAISEIGQVLGIEVVAEGVGDAATVARLRSIGVEYIQGSVIGKPMPLIPLGNHKSEAVIQPPARLVAFHAKEQMAS